MEFTECQFKDPVNLGDSAKPDWEYSKIQCEDWYVSVEHPTSTLGNFVVEKKYTYGEITLIFFQIIIFFIILFYILKKIFTISEVRIHSIHQKNF